MSAIEKFNISNFDIDMKIVANEVIMGPKNRLLQLLSELNNNFITSTYVYGNRSLLKPLKPLGVTPTYRWKSGYKDTIKTTIINRFDQWDKNSSSLRTYLRGRPERMRWNKKRFIDSLIKIEDAMKELRSENITMNDTIEKSMECYEIVMNKLQEKEIEAKEFFSNYPDIEYDLYITCQDSLSIRGEKVKLEDEWSKSKLNEALQIIKFESSALTLDVWFKKPMLSVKSQSDDVQKLVGKIPLEETGISFKIPLKDLVSSLFTKDFGKLRKSDVLSARDSNNRNYYMDICNYPYPKGVSEVGVYGVNESVTRHPFVSDSSDYTNNDHRLRTWIDKSRKTSHVCLGNMGDQISESFINLDFMGLLMDLNRWSTYICGVTQPLNNINSSLICIPEDQYSDEFISTICLQSKMIQNNILRLLGVKDTMLNYSREADDQSMNTFNWRMDSQWGGNAFDTNAILWYDQQNYMDPYDIKNCTTHYGWDFYSNYWVPNIKQMNHVMKIYSNRREEYYHTFLDDDNDRTELENDNDKWEWIVLYQEYQIAVMHTFVDFLNDNKCITRQSRFFKEMEEFINKVYTYTIKSVDAMNQRKVKPEIVLRTRRADESASIFTDTILDETQVATELNTDDLQVIEEILEEVNEPLIQETMEENMLRRMINQNNQRREV